MTKDDGFVKGCILAFSFCVQIKYLCRKAPEESQAGDEQDGGADKGENPRHFQKHSCQQLSTVS